MGKDSKAGEKVRQKIVILVCGMAGSGKSTLAKRLAKRYGLSYFSGGDALKACAIDEGYAPSERGWWEGMEGMRFLEERGRDNRFDRLVDEKLLERAEKGNVILDSWTMPWLLQSGFKIWLEASPEKRARRIAKRDGTSLKEALEALKSKEKKTRNIYKKLYGFNLGKDFAPFHLILGTDNLEADEVFRVMCMVIDNVVLCLEHGRPINGRLYSGKSE
jgi:cytidylate kinase